MQLSALALAFGIFEGHNDTCVLVFVHICIIKRGVEESLVLLVRGWTVVIRLCVAILARKLSGSDRGKIGLSLCLLLQVLIRFKSLIVSRLARY